MALSAFAKRRKVQDSINHGHALDTSELQEAGEKLLIYQGSSAPHRDSILAANSPRVPAGPVAEAHRGPHYAAMTPSPRPKQAPKRGFDMQGRQEVAVKLRRVLLRGFCVL